MDPIDLNAAFDPERAHSIFEAVGSDSFGERVLTAAQGFVGVEEVYAYRVTPAAQPISLVSTGDSAKAAQRAAWYERKFHNYDPLLRATQRDGSSFRHVDAGQIENREYRALCFEEPRFVDKLSFGWRGQGDALFLSFYRRRAAQRDQLQTLARLAEISLLALKQHSKMVSVQTMALNTRLETQLRKAYPKLTDREADVCARTLAGQSAKGIAEALGIGPASVLTYRQRAYQKYSISSASQLLEKLI